MAEIIALNGFMGCGKSTVARILSRRKSCFFFDLDDTIEMEEGRSIGEIFQEDGEAAFRKMEYKYLERIVSDFEQFDQTVLLSLGGGTLASADCAQLLSGNAKVIYLKAGVDQILYNLKIVGIENRPLLAPALTADGSLDENKAVEIIKELLERRAPIYESCSSLTLDIDGLSPEQIADLIEDSF